MKREVTYQSRHNFVLVCASGTYKFSNELGTLEQVSRTLTDNNCSKCLFDLRNSRVETNTLSAFQRPDTYLKVGFEQTTRIAVVTSHSSKELQFYETVCRNRCWSVRLFECYEEAISWLDGFEEHPPYIGAHLARLDIA